MGKGIRRGFSIGRRLEKRKRGTETLSTSQLRNTAQTLIDALENSPIGYAVIGGIASGYYGEPYSTRDLDLAISIKPETAAELIEILDRLGFDHNCRTLTDVLQTPCIYAIDQKNAVRVDLWTKPKGLILDRESLERRKRIKPEGWSEMWLVSPEDLIIMKLAAHRPRDIEQIQTILIRRRKEIDWKYLKKRAEQHNVQPELTEIQAKLKLTK